MPKELSPGQLTALAASFCRDLARTKDGPLPYSFAVHKGHDKENPHCHLLISERVNDGISRAPGQWFKRAAKDPSKGGAKKTNELRPREWLLQCRELWAERANHEGGFAQKGLAFTSEIEPEIVIPADSIRFAQVLINLLSNALKYTAEGYVSLSLQKAGDMVELLVADSGEGMAPDVVENISKRSAQAFKAVNSKGVGLYIAKLIINKHGWQLHIDSANNTGTRVRILM